MKHVLRSQQYDRLALERLFKNTDELIDRFENPTERSILRELLRSKTMFAVFYEPSTRTRFSFCSAARHLGMHVIQTENAREFSSAIKGETLEDTILALCQYDPDVIVLRHHETGGADRAANIVDQFNYPISIINAGDGKGQHPTQALLDIYTIRRELNKIDGLTITIGGDLLNGRTARSLVYLLTKFNYVKFVFISPENLRMDKDIINHLKEHNVTHRETFDLTDALSDADVVYWTRIQTERGSVNNSHNLSIGIEQMRLMKKKSILLHPLPRVDEIAKIIDSDSRAAYFRQVRNGMFIRMALLKDLCT